MISIKSFLAKHKNSILTNTVVVWTYLMLTILLLYSYPFDFANQMPGDGGDGYQFLWDMWWVKYSTTELGTNPYFTNHVFYPDGHTLFFHSLVPLAGIITIPFQDGLGLFFSYNFTVILGYVLGGFGAYLLAKYFTKNVYASYLAGIIFTFSPYHLGHTLGHLNLISIAGIPFYILFLFKLRDTSNMKYAVFAAFSLLISTFLGSWYHTVMLFVFTVFFIFYDILLKRKIHFSRKHIYGLALIPAIFVLASAPVTIPMVYESVTGKHTYAERTLNNQIDNSVDLIAFLTPGPDNCFFGEYTTSIEHSFNINLGGSENRAYLGYTVIGLLIFFWFKNRKPEFKHLLWLLLTGTFLVLSLGPLLKIMGTTSFTQYDVSVPLPGFLIRYLPGGTIFQAPARFAVLTYLGLGLLAAFAVKYIIENVDIIRKYKVLPLVLVVGLSSLIITEYNMSPYSSSYDPYVPQFYYQLRDMENTFSVLDLPAHYQIVGWYMYCGTVSEKPLIDGYLSRANLEQKQKLHEIPVVKLADILCENASIPSDVFLSLTDESSTQTSLQELEKLDTRFIIIHKQFFDKTAVSKLTEYLIETAGAPFYADYDTVVFKLT
ncbi:MAG: hypothetical protein CW716_01285 [Candidatus Bathyarchaeum sp.]|nr:MAG: hypothetical protein CW716_01285 [Candidatus Bathyarchaeum sp.]